MQQATKSGAQTMPRRVADVFGCEVVRARTSTLCGVVVLLVFRLHNTRMLLKDLIAPKATDPHTHNKLAYYQRCVSYGGCCSSSSSSAFSCFDHFNIFTFMSENKSSGARPSSSKKSDTAVSQSFCRSTHSHNTQHT